jgi:hypothetical protein
MRNAASTTRWPCLLVVAFLFLTPSSGAAANLNATKKPPGEKFFTEPTPRTFEFTFTDAALNQLRNSTRTYVPATVREGDRVWTNVGVRLKGMGSFRTIDEKPSLAVKFDEFATNQQYRGLSKLMFNNSVQDQTYLAEWLATQLFRDAGVPAARGTHARVIVNGRELGLYVVFEAMNKQFLKQHFTSASGNLYETYVQDINGRVEQDSGDDTSQTDLRTLIAACNISSPAERWRELNARLDVDQFASFVAMEMLTCHRDGYAIHTNNFRLYHHPTTDRFHFIAHGLDWAFYRENVSIQPPAKSLVGSAVFSTPEGQRLYRERVGTLFTNVFKVSVITNRINEAMTKIRLAGLSSGTLAKLETNAVWMRVQIEKRAARISEQLRGIEPEPLRFSADATARPADWRSYPDRGEPIMDRVAQGGRQTLHIAAQGERTRASWRSQVYLARGRYRFEGLIQTRGLSGGQARLRISGDTRSVGVNGTSPAWRPVVHEFEITEPGIDVEFVCEFYALQGEAWFDLESLLVRRL